MPHTYSGALIARTNSSGNPITNTLTVTAGTTVVCILLKGVGATNRAGGAPTWRGFTFTQANSTQKAVTSPEASAEIWYLLNPTAGSGTLTIPNTGAISCYYTVVGGAAKAGGYSMFNVANGSNNTSANPAPGNINVLAGDIVFSIAASGATTWAPSAQSGTIIANTDDGAHGGGEQYNIPVANGTLTTSWTQASDDWGAVVAAFSEVEPTRIEFFKHIHVPNGMAGGEI